MQGDMQQQHQEVLKMIEALSDATNSDGASSVRNFYRECKTISNLWTDKQSLFRI
jgi:hypothetical protein